MGGKKRREETERERREGGKETERGEKEGNEGKDVILKQQSKNTNTISRQRSAHRSAAAQDLTQQPGLRLRWFVQVLSAFATR